MDAEASLRGLELELGNRFGQSAAIGAVAAPDGS